jgi:glycosyltransferase involved in cell wall biosynthesis
VILGRGTLERSLRQQAADLGVADRVLFAGFTDNPWAWIAKAELFVLPSRWEGFPSVVAETLACAAPALVTACDFGPREVVEHGRSGWVVPPDDVGAFGAALDMLLRRPDLTQQFRRNGPLRAATFDIDEMVEAYTDLFQEQAEAALVPTAPRARPRRSSLRPRTATSG